MDDDFESQYADELEVLDDFEPPEYSPTKSKKSLKFTTPQNKIKSQRDDLDDSFQLTPLDSPNKENGSVFKESNNQNNTPLSRRGSEKRLRSVEEDSICMKGKTFEDDLLSCEFPSKKKQKIDLFYPEDAETVSLEARILLEREKLAKNLKPSANDSNAKLMDEYDFERPRVFTRIPKGNFISTTGSEGQRVYMGVKDEILLETECDKVGRSVRTGGLLSVPFVVLRDQVEEERQSKLMAEANKLTLSIRETMNEINADEGVEEDMEEEDDLAALTEDMQRHLWVEKYAPKTYTDLLSEENINRTLLHWLKLWDFVVFDKDVKFIKKDNNKKKQQQLQQQNNKKGKFQPQVQDELDKFNRPMQKLVLLNGPPGLGKTTLAHIAARHAGYNVVEINASDDRSAEVFKNKLEAATQMKALLGADPRPNCLVIDEIDGAPQPAITMLLNLVKRTEEPDKKKKESGILLRPIICICNDQYVPALRQLRQLALVVNFPTTDPAKLAGRLYQVTQNEKYKADMNCLLALCEKTDNDIRSCLNTLQFVKQQNKELSVRTIQSMNIGQKDSQKSLFSLWYEIFSLSRLRRNRFINLQDIKNADEWQINNTTPAAREKNILHATHSAGEYEKTIQGMFENYPEINYKDPRMDGLNTALDWLGFVDQANQYIQHKQDYSLMTYIPYIAVIFHFVFASNQIPKVKYPHVQYDAKMKKEKCQNLVRTLMSDMVPCVRKFVDPELTVMEVLPPLTEIIQPNLRPVNTQLYSAREKADLVHLVHTMISYNMTYRQEKSLDGQYLYVLDPNVEDVVRFPGMKQHKQLTYGAKQMIAREIELEKMRKKENGKMSDKKAENVQPQTGNSTPVVPNHLQKLEAKPLSRDEDVPVMKDFFGRVIKRKTPEAKSKTTEKEEKDMKRNVLNTELWFHFKEGFSNAVRRNIKVKDFL